MWTYNSSNKNCEWREVPEYFNLNYIKMKKFYKNSIYELKQLIFEMEYKPPPKVPSCQIAKNDIHNWAKIPSNHIVQNILLEKVFFL